jgi:hypothetical protein
MHGPPNRSCATPPATTRRITLAVSTATRRQREEAHRCLLGLAPRPATPRHPAPGRQLSAAQSALTREISPPLVAAPAMRWMAPREMSDAPQMSPRQRCAAIMSAAPWPTFTAPTGSETPVNQAPHTTNIDTTSLRRRSKYSDKIVAEFTMNCPSFYSITKTITGTLAGK